MSAVFVRVRVPHDLHKGSLCGVVARIQSKWDEERRGGEQTLFFKEFHSKRKLRQGAVAAEG